MTMLRLLLLLTFVVCGFAVHIQDVVAKKFQSMGVVDSFAITSMSGDLEFSAIGWVGAGKTKSAAISLVVELGSNVIYEGEFERFERPDVVTVTGRKDWIRSGWRITASIPRSIKNGEYDLHVRTKFNDGTFVNLAVDNQQFKKLLHLI